MVTIFPPVDVGLEPPMCADPDTTAPVAAAAAAKSSGREVGLVIGAFSSAHNASILLFLL